jgi:hypothetical protein
MISSVKPVLTEDLCVVQKDDFFNNMLCVQNVHLTKSPSTFIRDKPILSSVRVLHKDYTASVHLEEKFSGRGSQEA